MAKTLTAKAVEQAKPGTNRREIPDGGCAGLYLVIQPKPTGARSWAFRYRFDGKPRKMTLGTVNVNGDDDDAEPAVGGYLTLAGARKIAGNQRHRLARGIDPAAEWQKEKAKARESAAIDRDLFKAVAQEWLRHDQADNRSHGEVKRILNKDVLPTWGERRVQAITRRDAIELIDGIADRGAVVMARRVRAHLHRMFRWCLARGIIDANPMADLPKPGKETPRDRVLTDEELTWAWRAAGQVPYPFGPLFRLLILTGARREEIGALRWAEIDQEHKLIRLTGERTKTGEPRTFPLSPPAVEIIEALPKIVNEGGKAVYAFTGNGNTPASGWSRAKNIFDRKIHELRREAAERAGNTPDTVEHLAPWRLHDLRRTLATGLQRLGFRLEVIEAVLGHVSGSRAGIVGVYQRHTFEEDKRRALDAWARFVKLPADPPVWTAVSARLNAGDHDKAAKARALFNSAIIEGGKRWAAYLAQVRGQAMVNVVRLGEAKQTRRTRQHAG